MNSLHETTIDNTHSTMHSNILGLLTFRRVGLKLAKFMYCMTTRDSPHECKLIPLAEPPDGRAWNVLLQVSRDCLSPEFFALSIP